MKEETYNLGLRHKKRIVKGTLKDYIPKNWNKFLEAHNLQKLTQ